MPSSIFKHVSLIFFPPSQGATAATRAEQGGQAGSKEKSIEAYGTLNRFFCAFIDHVSSLHNCLN